MISDPRESRAEQRAQTLPFANATATDTLLICFSHLRWDFVFQRPQHLLTRFASIARVMFWEEPVVSDLAAPELQLAPRGERIVVATPLIPAGLEGEALTIALRGLLDAHLAPFHAQPIWRWYYTPMMFAFSGHLEARCTVYDCMDELANFRFAPPQLHALERQLMAEADVVFTGGYSLYEAKRDRHSNIHPFPSSVDRDHFAQARTTSVDPPDQSTLPHPRLGYYGVVDERLDLELIAALAAARPHWSIVIVGPIAKLSPEDLPRAANIHYLGQKTYQELPAYLSGWDVALMPFAINEATRFISPTKTPEYLAGARPVVSTPIADVERHYGQARAVTIAATSEEFVAACEAALAMDKAEVSVEADQLLNDLSWDRTFEQMRSEIAKAERPAPSLPPPSWAARRWPRVSPAFDYLIVGAGFAGAVLAERLATQLDKKVLLVDRRDHIGGNAFDETNHAGILMHRYGPHIFHTNSADVFAYLSKFTRWRAYEHRVLARVNDLHVPMPINRTTLNQLYGQNLKTDAEAEAFLASRAEPVAAVRTSEDVVVSKVGRELYETFFRGYTRKQWGMDPSELDKSVTARVPTRTNDDDRYFTDKHQAMPADGYTRLFENMLDDPRITIETNVDFFDLDETLLYDKLIFTGPIDAYFDYRFGPLPYRSLRFEHRTLNQEWFQQVGTVNYPDEATPFTRITEYKHLTGQNHRRTTITYEYPEAEGDPFYPVPRLENQTIFKKYESLAAQRADVLFVGRLATYRYYNMDQVVGQALAAFKRIAASETRASSVLTGQRATIDASA